MAAKKRRAGAKKKRAAAKRYTRTAAKKKRAAPRAKGAIKANCKRPPKTFTFTYSCKTGVCVVTPRRKHMCPRDTAVLTANGTDVTITFTTALGSPFVSGTNPITVLAGTSQSETVDSRTGTFRYKIDCQSCPSSLHIPPEMIVP